MTRKRQHQTKTIEPIQQNEDGEWDFDSDQLPTLELSKRDAKHLYHGMFRHDFVVELPDGSMGQLSIAPSKWHRTPFSKLRSRWYFFKRNVYEKVGEWLNRRLGL